MPTPAEIILPGYPDVQITIDLDFGLPSALAAGQNHPLDRLVREAVKKSPLAIHDTNGLTTQMIETACMKDDRPCTLISEDQAALQQRLDAAKADQDRMAQIDDLADKTSRIASLLRSIETIPPTASIGWLRDLTRNHPSIFIPCDDEPFLKLVNSDIASLETMSLGKDVNNGMVSPVFGYATIHDGPGVGLPFVADAMGDALLSDPRRFFADKANAIDWETAWASYAEDHDGVIPFDLDAMDTLERRLKSILSVVIDRLHKKASQTRDADTLYQDMQTLLVQERHYIDAILTQWNAEQSSGLQPDKSRILTFAQYRPGTDAETTPLDLRGLLGILHESAKGGIADIQTRYGTLVDAPLPWVQEMDVRLKDAYDQTIAAIPAHTRDEGVTIKKDNIIPFSSNNVIAFPTTRRNDTPSGP